MPVETGINRLLDFELKVNKDQPNGYPSLDAGTKIPIAEIPDLSGAYLPLAGGTMTGPIDLIGDPSPAVTFNITGAPNYGGILHSTITGLLMFAGDTIDFFDTTTHRSLAQLNQFIAKSDTPVNYIGSGLYLLRVNTGATAVEFTVPYLNQTIQIPYSGVTATPTSLDSTYYDVDVDATAGNKVINLPSASGIFRTYRIAKTDASTNVVTIACFGIETINGALNLILTKQYQAVTISADPVNANWVVFTDNRTGYWREFFGLDGVSVSGTWVWSSNGSQTNFNSVRGNTVGFFANSTGPAINNEYKWTDVFLPIGTYQVDLVYVKTPGSGIASFYWNGVLATLDQYAAGNAFNQTYSFTFTVTAAAQWDFRFYCAAKNGASTNYEIIFSRFVLWKTG